MKEEIVIFLFCVTNVVKGFVLNSEGNKGSSAREIPPSDVDNKDYIVNELHSEVYTLVKRYQCFIQNISHTEILLFGANSWSFPEQVVNLTLSYPLDTETSDQSIELFKDFVVTGIRVILYTNGRSTRGIINHGGMLQKAISLNFICEDVSRLSYKFWLYGVPEASINLRYLSQIDCIN